MEAPLARFHTGAVALGSKCAWVLGPLQVASGGRLWGSCPTAEPCALGWPLRHTLSPPAGRRRDPPCCHACPQSRRLLPRAAPCSSCGAAMSVPGVWRQQGVRNRPQQSWGGPVAGAGGGHVGLGFGRDLCGPWGPVLNLWPSLHLLHLGQGRFSIPSLVGVWGSPSVGHAGAGSQVSPANEVVLSLAVRAPGWMPQACL